MFTNLKVAHYQSVGDADLPLVAITVVTGPSSSGKSALLRSVFAALDNPRGSAAVQNGFPEASVTLTDSTGSVTYTKSAKGPATYALDGTDFTAVGSAVPDEVTEWLNLQPASVGRQFDPPFLLTESPSKRAAHFSALTQARVLLDAVGKLNADNRSLSASAKASRKLSGEYAARVDAAELHVANLSDAKDALYQASADLNRVTQVRDALLSAHGTVSQAAPVLLRARKVATTLAPLVEATQNASQRVEAVAALRARLDTASTTARRYASSLDRAQRVRDTLTPAVEAADAASRRAQDAFAVLSRLVSVARVVPKLSALEERVTALQARLEAVNAARAVVDRALVSKTPPPSTCPVCQQALVSPDSISLVLGHMNTHDHAGAA